VTSKQDTERKPEAIDHYRRAFLIRLGITTAATVGATSAHGAWGGKSLGDTFADFFQQHYQRMTPEELQETLDRIERKAERQYGTEISCTDTPPLEGVIFGYAINISKCKGYRDCVEACAEENNLGPDIRYIHVLEMDEGNTNL
jgi:molybdopterin-containing oxidoreductase family iron-sulfur binding subunit